jgi:SAM-dependent methyltransferase
MHLQNLGYFLEWGGKTWERLIRHAIEDFIGPDLHGRKLLDVGTRYGKMACLFALLGGQVVGIDTSEQAIAQAVVEAEKWRVSSRVAFQHTDGSLDAVPDASFDVIFTKSVLVVVPELGGFLLGLAAKLRPGGKVVFVENAYGNAILHAARRLRHRRWDYRAAHYFTEKEIVQVKYVFDICQVVQATIPPVYLILGHKR